jgi:hypothetical protein
MIPTSTNYNNSIFSPIRKVYGKLIIDFSDTIQQTYYGDDIFLIHLVETKDPTNNTLPIGQITSNQLEIKLNNSNHFFDPHNTDSPLYGLMKANCKIQAYLGLELPDQTIEWIPLGTFWSGDWNVPEDEPWVSTIAKDRLNLLDRSLYQTGSVVSTPAVVVHVDDSQSDWSQGILSNTTATGGGDLILNISGVN